ncbi:hypothetical protein RSAG8_09684, partial [Rhizoctonia solani AG-8 WAC10335]
MYALRVDEPIVPNGARDLWEPKPCATPAACVGQSATPSARLMRWRGVREGVRRVMGWVWREVEGEKAGVGKGRGRCDPARRIEKQNDAKVQGTRDIRSWGRRESLFGMNRLGKAVGRRNAFTATLLLSGMPCPYRTECGWLGALSTNVYYGRSQLSADTCRRWWVWNRSLSGGVSTAAVGRVTQFAEDVCFVVSFIYYVRLQSRVFFFCNILLCCIFVARCLNADSI